ncbi:MAG: hypothetical protein ACT4QC_05740 [Planctomycetaceae bacterium]
MANTLSPFCNLGESMRSVDVVFLIRNHPLDPLLLSASGGLRPKAAPRSRRPLRFHSWLVAVVAAVEKRRDSRCFFFWGCFVQKLHLHF